jgi:hypothetical protein
MLYIKQSHARVQIEVQATLSLLTVVTVYPVAEFINP